MIYLLHDGSAFALKDAVEKDGTVLVPVFDDSSRLSSVLVSAVWNDETVVLVDKSHRLVAKVRYIHISGPVFSDFLRTMRKLIPSYDFASLAQLTVLDRVDSETDIEAFGVIGPSGKTELHLDNPRLR